MRDAPPRAAWWLRALAIANIVALTAVRLVTDADDFNNWDLISLVNANSFGSLSELLLRPEVHFVNPFRFPYYNTGAESVLSLLIHRAMSGISLYWSNTVVVAFYDVALLAGLGALFRLVWRDAFAEAAAWMLCGMSFALLTFMALSAFNVQAYATIVAGLVGCELVLQSRRRSGIGLIAVAFLFISQAYPITFFLPVFCLVWTTARVMMALGNDVRTPVEALRGAGSVVLVVIACVAVVEAGSFGTYLGKAFGAVSRPMASDRSEVATALFERIATLSKLALVPQRGPGGLLPGFGPHFVIVTLVLAVLSCPFVGRRDALPHQQTGWRLRWRPLLPAAAWTGLVVLGYLPAFFGPSPKSQRCVFGDLFLAMAVAQLVVWLVRGGMPRSIVASALVASLACSDIVYARAFLAEDHRRVHTPVFDYDVADGRARHDTDATLDYMRDRARRRPSALVVHYPSGLGENTTDPAMFHARFLRRVGPWKREGWLFLCRFCEVRYGCPFPEVADKGCRTECCFEDLVRTISTSDDFAGRRLHVWWFDDDALDDTPRRDRLLARLKKSHRVEDLGTPVPERRWHHYELTPRRRCKNSEADDERSKHRAPQRTGACGRILAGASRRRDVGGMGSSMVDDGPPGREVAGPKARGHISKRPEGGKR